MNGLCVASGGAVRVAGYICWVQGGWNEREREKLQLSTSSESYKGSRRSKTGMQAYFTWRPTFGINYIYRFPPAARSKSAFSSIPALLQLIIKTIPFTRRRQPLVRGNSGNTTRTLTLASRWYFHGCFPRCHDFSLSPLFYIEAFLPPPYPLLRLIDTPNQMRATFSTRKLIFAIHTNTGIIKTLPENFVLVFNLNSLSLYIHADASNFCERKEREK